MPRQPQSQEGALQEALPLPALVAPALATAHPDQAYLRWKAVIHSMSSNNAAAARGPDFLAARWFTDQMSHREGSTPVSCQQGGYIKPLLRFMRFSFVLPESGLCMAWVDSKALGCATRPTVHGQPNPTEPQRLQCWCSGPTAHAVVSILSITVL